MRSRLTLGPLVLVSALACGSRTSLPGDDSVESDLVDAAADATTPERIFPDAASPGARRDAAQDAPGDARSDAAHGQGCARNSECEDNAACTDDVCDPMLRRCSNFPVNARCTVAFCEGTGTCDAKVGCRVIPRSCDDGIACTRDLCGVTEEACLHVPDDALCPLSHGCDPAIGCQARALAHTASELYEVKLPSGALRLIHATTDTLTDIALHGNGTLYGVNYGAVVTVDSNTGKVTVLASTGNFNALDAAPDGTLYAGGGNSLFTVDVTNGTATFFAAFPSPLESSGDLAFLGQRLVATARGGSANDTLVEFDRTTGAATILGSIGFSCVWGLAACGPTLYGLTCEGRVLRIDGTTGAATQVASSQVSFYGATAR